MKRSGAALIATVIAGAGLVACGSQTTPQTSAPSSSVTGDLKVFAAASLAEAFTQIGRDFEAAHPGIDVTFNFASSSALAQQINQGAPADVLASASPETTKLVSDEGGMAGTPRTFAKNRLEIAVPKGNPGKIVGLADFADAGKTIAICAEQVPCGAAAITAFDLAGITARPDTLEADVKAVLTKVRLGEVDAGLVYRTDVKATRGEIQGIAFPESAKVINDYPIAALAKAENPSAAKALVRYVLSKDARAVLTAAGFLAP